MIKCKIGIVSRPIDDTHDCFLLLGEFYDKHIRENVVMLYQVYQNLKYMTYFLIQVNNGNIIVDNAEDLHHMRKEFKLTRTCRLSKTLVNGKYKMRFPELYDTSCMVPLFNQLIDRSIFPSIKSSEKHIFIITPHEDPFIRGKMIDECLSVIKIHEPIFYLTGQRFGTNKKKTWQLSQRYLLLSGVSDQNILVNENTDFPECIPNILDTIPLAFEQENYIVYLVCPNVQMGSISMYIRQLNKKVKRSYTVRYLCNF